MLKTITHTANVELLEHSNFVKLSFIFLSIGNFIGTAG